MLTLGGVSVYSEPQSSINTITVYKDPSCGCCSKWVDHLREHGYQVTAHDVSDMTKIKTKYGVPRALSSCHTAVVDGYVVEGHVPADVISRLLTERPKVVGITVPDMPMGSPGMEGPYSEPYDVLTFDSQGNTKVYTSH
ncbi:MAG: DUF411 domain-containing protein [Deltaproteobacteria bacterium]|nr:DUF411 domain-containing protein [Deltaproteobacteria bacterium]